MSAILAGVDNTSRLTRYSERDLVLLYVQAPLCSELSTRIRQLGIWRPNQLITVSGDFRWRSRRRVRAGRQVRQRLLRRQPATTQQPLNCASNATQGASNGSITFSCLNIRSLHRKVDDVLELFRDRSIDVLCLSETWCDADSVCIRRLRSAGFSVVDQPRPRSIITADSLAVNHGGVAVVATACSRLSAVAVDVHPTTFEVVVARVTVKRYAGTVVVIYRPGSEAVQSAFFDELADLLDRVATLAEPIHLVGDLNIRLDRADDPNAVRLVDLLGSYGLQIRVSSPTHQQGGLLDVVATRCDLVAPVVSVVDVGLSDHHLLQWTVSAARPTPVVETISRRPWRTLDVDGFRVALSSSALCQPDCWSGLDVDRMSTLYDVEMAVLLDQFVPSRTITRRPRPSDPWFDVECRTAKRLTRRLERVAAASAKSANVSSAASASDAWRAQRRSYRELRNRKRDAFWSSAVAANRSSPRQLWRSVDLLLGRGQAPVGDAITVDQFHEFFVDKVETVRAATAGGPLPTFSVAPNASSFTDFQCIVADDVISAIKRLPDKSCAADTLPTPQLKLVADLIAPFLAELFSRSMLVATVPEAMKSAYITPLIKKPDSDASDPRSYRPISNLSVVSKLLERTVFGQLCDYLTKADLLPRLQSAYRAHHSTETAVLKVLTDILHAVDGGDLSVLALLDLSAAFDTVDHDILLKRLQISFGIGGVALDWFRSYLTGRVEHVRRGALRSASKVVRYGVPQGSVLGPLLFILYTADLISLIEEHGFRPHLYADDTQIQGSCSPDSASHLQSTLSECLDAVFNWMRANRLQLNTAKTEILWCSTSRRRHQLPTAAVRAGSDHVTPSSTVRDLGIFIDSDVAMKSHVSRTVSGCFAVLRQLRSIRRSVSDAVFQTLVVSLVMPRLDYGNATLAGLPDYQYRRLQSVLNAAARLIHRSKRSEHITPLLRDLHWLRSRERIDFKLAVLVYRCLHGLAPRYLSDGIRRVTDVNRRCLRSSSSTKLFVQRTRLVTVGDRAFPIAGSRLWNALPGDVISAPTLSVFRNRLKTHLFNRSFPS